MLIRLKEHKIKTLNCIIMDTPEIWYSQEAPSMTWRYVTVSKGECGLQDT